MHNEDATAFEPVSHSFTSQGLDLHYLDWGNSDKPLLILVHGSRDHARSWDWTARALRASWHIVAFDLRGHGDSAWSPDGAYNLGHHVVDLAELVDHFGDQPVTIIAHSLGGSITARYAGLYPGRLKKLVLVDGLGPRPVSVEAWNESGAVTRLRDWVERRRNPATRKQRRFATLDEATARMAAANPHLSDEQARHLAVHGVRRHPDGYSWKYDPLVFAFAPDDFQTDNAVFWDVIETPTLICWGTESFTIDRRLSALAKHFANHQTHEFEQAGHWPHHDRFEAFVAMLRDFL